MLRVREDMWKVYPSYARQFMGKLNKPKVDYIKGISPAIAV